MGGRYGGDIKGRRHSNWSTKAVVRAMATVGAVVKPDLGAVGRRVRGSLPRVDVRGGGGERKAL